MLLFRFRTFSFGITIQDAEISPDMQSIVLYISDDSAKKPQNPESFGTVHEHR